MKRKVFLFVLFFLLCGVIINPVVFVGFANAQNNQTKYEISVQGRKFFFEGEMLKKNTTLSKIQKRLEKERLNSSAQKLLRMGFSKKEVVNYLLPETIFIEEKLSKIFNKQETEDKIKVFKNECNIKIFNGKKGYFLDINTFYNEIYKSVLNEENNIKINVGIREYKNCNIKKEDYVPKGCFETNFENSSPERKNNIKIALSALDGIVLDEGEILSFNSVTGERSEKNGYKQAKIISGGTFVSGFGGGVCQVSTTLYNASLLSGLEVLEVHNHSLPVSYVEPCFDAMVNSGSSDLVIRNNSGGKIIITTSYSGNKCKVKIFGKENKFIVKRVSEKTKIIPAKVERVENDYKRFGLEKLSVGEEKRISYAKDGFYSNGYLEFYDKNGNKKQKEKIRSCKYNPTEGVIVKREN